MLDHKACNTAPAEIGRQRKPDRAGADYQDRSLERPRRHGAWLLVTDAGVMPARIIMDRRGETRAYDCLQAASAAPSRKKAPPERRGKTDSLEISQRGKEAIYAKFTARCKRKKHKNRSLIAWNLCNFVAGTRVLQVCQNLCCIMDAYRYHHKRDLGGPCLQRQSGERPQAKLYRRRGATRLDLDIRLY